MKTLEQILHDSLPFYPDFSTDRRKMRFMFLLEDGSLIGDVEGNHFDLLGGNYPDEEPRTIERSFCDQNKALRFSFQRYGIKDEFWCLYVEIFNALPNEAQWITLGRLYCLKGWQNTDMRWDVLMSETKHESIHGEGTLNEFRRALYPQVVTLKKRTGRKPRRGRR